uniref:Uncharacterized protein n=1 Tax=Arundo donax TaxID=35708 RepID=A0A0A9EDD0_ARUDO
MVMVSAELLFDEIMMALQLPMPMFSYTETFEDECVAYIEFYPDINAFIAGGPRKKLCGFSALSRKLLKNLWNQTSTLQSDRRPTR